MAESGGERSEAATARRRDEARQEGNIARSHDLAPAGTLVAGMLMLRFFGLHIFLGLRDALAVALGAGFVPNAARVGGTDSLGTFCVGLLVKMAGPVVLCVVVTALVLTLAQVGFIFTTKPLEFNLARLSPLRGLGNLFNFRGVFRLGMSLGKLLLLGIVAGVVVWHRVPLIIRLPELELLPMFVAVSGMVYDLALKLALLLFLLALIDYAYQRWQRERDLRMTKQEVKDEMRRMEGDPQIKARRVRVARQLLLQRINQAVPKADVVVTNPTHFAVALRYDAKTMRAPRVVAKGADFLALRIRQLATLHGVPMVERKSVAQALYKNVEVGQEVPPQLYNAVAEVLAYVYRLSGKKIA